MRKWKLYMAAALVLLICLLFGCSGNKEAKGSYVFCLNDSRTGLVKVYYEKKATTTLDAVDEILDVLDESGESIDHTPVLPPSVTIKEHRLEGGIVILDLSGEYRQIPSLEEKLVRAAMVESLVRVEGVAGVHFYVEGEELRDSAGESVGLLTDDDYVQGASTALNAYDTKTLTLYFADKSGEKLIPVDTEVKYNTNVALEKVIVEKLMKGPKKSEADPTINPQANLLGVTVKDHVCYVNFDREFLNAVNGVLPEVTVYSVVNSVIRAGQADRVQITINGELENTFMEKVDLREPLSFSDKWIE